MSKRIFKVIINIKLLVTINFLSFFIHHPPPVIINCPFPFRANADKRKCNGPQNVRDYKEIAQKVRATNKMFSRKTSLTNGA